MWKRIALGAIALMLLAGSVLAQQPMGQGDLGRVYVTRPKNVKDYEAGRKRHMAFHAKQNDTWAWYTYEVVAGDNAGEYITATFGHKWADFDTWSQKLEAADTADADINLAPYSAGGSNAFYRYRADMSLAPPPDPPTPYSSVSFFVVKNAGDFINSVRKINEGLKKVNWPTKSAWWQLVLGGEPVFVLVTERKNWADFAPPPKSLDEAMAEAYGQEQGAAILKEVRANIDKTWSEAIKYRADLSYVPKK